MPRVIDTAGVDHPSIEPLSMPETQAEKLLWAVLALVVLAVFGGWWMRTLWPVVHARLEFDDAYMFYRYALHVRQGLGVSWNPDGVHTYGQTAPLWGWVVVALTTLPLSGSEMLRLGSVVSSVGAVAAIAWAVAANSTSWLRHVAVVLPLVAWPLMHSGLFFGNATNGMETMLGTALCGLYVGLVLRWHHGALRPEWVAAVGLLLFLTRPEAALVVVLLPAMLHGLVGGSSLRSLAILLGVFLAAVLVEAMICRWYFGAALPLSFYMKSQHAYRGYAGRWRPVSAAYRFVAEYRWTLIAIALLVRKQDWRLLAAFGATVALLFGYLCTVTQIMGFDSRYSMPYLALLVVPALLVVDRRVTEFGDRKSKTQIPFGNDKKRVWMLVGHVVAAVVVVLATQGRVPEGVARVIDRKLIAKTPVYDPVVTVTDAGKPLPDVNYLQAMYAVTETLAKPLPQMKLAASEVGYIGGEAPGSTIIDIAGLNDTAIALHGFSMAALLARRPDVIWMPHPDYTYQRGVMLGDPQLLAEYDVYAGMANYGMAVRKDSGAGTQAAMQALWSRLYPGLAMRDYAVRSVRWSEQPHRLGE